MKRILSIALSAALASSALALPAAAASKTTSVTMYPLFYRQLSETEAEGGHSKIVISMTTGTKKPLQVSISEDSVGGTGDQWRSASWSAATAAILAVGADLTGTKFEIEVKGRIDGPSAGALMTVGMLSLIRGEKLKKDVAMTGSINPDGTIGPVGGILYKLDGVKKLKAKRFVVPMGQSVDTDFEGNEVNVKRLASEDGIKVGEVATIQTAYATFTGKKLPEPLVPEPAAKFSKKAASGLEELVESQIEAADQNCSELEEIAGAVGGPALDVLSNAQDAYGTGEAAFDDGALAVAFEEFGSANIVCAGMIPLASPAADLANGTIALEDFIGNIAPLAASFDQEVEEFSLLLDEKLPTNTSEAIAYLSGVDSFLGALARAQVAQYTIEQATAAVAEGDDPAAWVSPVVKAALTIGALGAYVEPMTSLFELGMSLPGAKFAKGVKVARIANFLKQFAEAELASFEALVVDTAAESEGVTSEQVQSALLGSNEEYIAADFARGLMGDAETSDAPAEQRAWQALAGAMALASNSNQLLSSEYSFGAIRDEDGEVVEVSNLVALQASLDRGNDQLRSAIALTSSRKTDPFRMVGQLHSAEARQETGEPADLLRAASLYLNGFLYGRVAAYLGGYQSDGYAAKTSK